MIKETVIGITEQFNQSTIGTIFWLILSITGAYKLIKECVLDFAELMKQLHKIGIRDTLMTIAFTLIMFILPLMVLIKADSIRLSWVWQLICWVLIVSYFGTVWIVVWLKGQLDDIDLHKKPS